MTRVRTERKRYFNIHALLFEYFILQVPSTMTASEVIWTRACATLNNRTTVALRKIRISRSVALSLSLRVCVCACVCVCVSFTSSSVWRRCCDAKLDTTSLLCQLEPCCTGKTGEVATATNQQFLFFLSSTVLVCVCCTLSSGVPQADE